MIVLDMDGVLVDFCEAAYRTHGRTCGAHEPDCYDFFEQWGMTAEEFWAPIDQQGPDFWANLSPYPWFTELVSLSHNPTFIVATTPSRCAVSTAGKVQALQKLFGVGFRDYCITPRKWYLAAPSRVLIDDNEENCERFVAMGGRAILFPQPWNRNRDMTADRLEWVRRQLVAMGREAA